MLCVRGVSRTLHMQHGLAMLRGMGKSNHMLRLDDETWDAAQDLAFARSSPRDRVSVNGMVERFLMETVAAARKSGELPPLVLDPGAYEGGRRAPAESQRRSR